MKNFIACVAGLNLGWGTLSYVTLTLGVLVDGYGLSLPAAGMLASVELTAMAAVMLIVGRQTHRLTPGTTAALGGAICALANFLTRPELNLLAMGAVRALSGVGAGVVAAVVYAVVGKSKNSIRLLANANIVLILIAAAFFMFMPRVYAQYGYTAYFISYGVMALICAIALLALDADRSALPAPGQTAGAAQPLGLGAIFILAAAFLMWFGYTAVWSISERIATDLKMAPTTIGQVLSIATLAGLIGTGIASAMSGRFGNLAPLIFGNLVLALIYIALTFTDNALVYSWSMYGFGVVLFVVMPYFVGLASARDGSGVLVTQVGATYPIAAALAPFIASSLISEHSYRTVGIVAAAATLACVMALALSAKRSRAQ